MSATKPRSCDTDAALAEARRRSRSLEAELRAEPRGQRVVTGDRPTGPLHLGHYFGTLENRVKLQELGVDVFVVVADYQTIIDRTSPETMRDDVAGLVADYLAVGIDPERTTIFAHSEVGALNQLMLPLLSCVTVAELSRNPTVKDELEAAGGRAMSALMFSYPVHQAADILSCRGTVVPVGRDQLPHLELARSIARRFNRRYCPELTLFPEPRALLSEAPMLLGIDGTKMSKSRGNAIAISASAEETARLIGRAKTDLEREITYDPERRPDVANLLLLAALFQRRRPEDIAEDVGSGGAAALKRTVTESVNERLREIRARRAELISDAGYLRAVLASGAERARAVAGETLREARLAMHMNYDD